MLSRELFTMQVLGILICPVVLPLLIVLNLLDTRKIWTYKKLTFTIVGAVSLLIAFFTHSSFTLIDFVRSSWYELQIIFGQPVQNPFEFTIKDYVLSDFWTFGIISLLMAFTYLAAEYTGGEQAVRAEKMREQNRIKYRRFPWNEEVNTLTLATTGGGKTVRLNKQVEAILKSKPKKERDFVCIIDGKGAGPSDEYGIFNTMTVLAKRYHHPFVVVNATTNPRLPAQTTKYNPFYGLSSQEVKEMVSALMFPDLKTNAGAEYYKNLFEAWVLSVVELMLQCGEYISLPNIVKLLDKDNLMSWIQKHQDNITASQRDEIQKQIQSSWNDVRSNIVKLQTFMKGLGGQVFSGTTEKNPFSIREAYKNNYLTLFLISELAAPEFAAGIGRVIALDIRVLVNGRINGLIDKDRACRFLADEFSGYVSSSYLSILSRARSSGSSLHLFSQSLFDLEKISPDFLGAVLDNVTVYHIGRQNSPDSAEKCANIIGTEHAAKLTSVSIDQRVAGFGTHRTTKEFKIHPDQIKELKNNVFIRYDKTKPEDLAFVKNEFVDMEL